VIDRLISATRTIYISYIRDELTSRELKVLFSFLLNTRIFLN